MCDPAHWPSVRADVLRGWIKCRDGRLYHPVVVDKAKDAWRRKCAQRTRTEAARAAKKLRKSEPEFLNEINPGAPVTDLSQTCDDPVTASKGQGQGRIDSEAKEASASLPLAELPPPDPIKHMWDQGIALLMEGGATEKKARPLIGKWRKAFGEAAVMAAIAKCQQEQASEPVAFIAGCLVSDSESYR
jgi:hypothetical protein